MDAFIRFVQAATDLAILMDTENTLTPCHPLGWYGEDVTDANMNCCIGCNKCPGTSKETVKREKEVINARFSLKVAIKKDRESDCHNISVKQGTP